MAIGTRLRIRDDGTVDRIGIDDGSSICELVSMKHPQLTTEDFNDRAWFIVVKVPGGSYWAGRGEQGYAAAEYVTYRIMEQSDTSPDVFVCHEVISVPVRAKIKPGTNFKANFPAKEDV